MDNNVYGGITVKGLQEKQNMKILNDIAYYANKINDLQNIHENAMELLEKYPNDKALLFSKSQTEFMLSKLWNEVNKKYPQANIHKYFIEKLYNKMLNESVNIPYEFSEIVDDNFNELLNTTKDK